MTSLILPRPSYATLLFIFVSRILLGDAAAETKSNSSSGEIRVAVIIPALQKSDVRWPSEAVENRIACRGEHCAETSPNVNCSCREFIIHCP